jgi:hypothetical protein
MYVAGVALHAEALTSGAGPSGYFIYSRQVIGANEDLGEYAEVRNGAGLKRAREGAPIFERKRFQVVSDGGAPEGARQSFGNSEGAGGTEFLVLPEERLLHGLGHYN